MDRQRHAMLTLAGALWACGAFAAPCIVRDGQPNAEIVIAENPPRMVRLAAEELQSLLARISGAELPVVHAPGAAEVQVYVGRSPHADRLGIDIPDLPHDGYRMVSGAHWLALIGEDEDYVPKEPYARNPGDRERAGREWDALTGAKFGFPGAGTFKAYYKSLDVWSGDKRGSLNGVYGFLRSLGARWYAPGEIGEVLPSLKDIPLPRVDETVRPDFGCRNLYFYGGLPFLATREDALWQFRLGLNARDGIGGHGINPVIHHPNTRQAHPEFYLLVNGRRETVARGGKPCLATEALVRAHAEFARRCKEIYGGTRVSAMPTDAYGPPCQCELCRGRFTPERGGRGYISDYVWDYVNRVAAAISETDPDIQVSSYAYSDYLLPPQKIDKLHPNVLVGICQTRANFHDPETRREFLDLRQAWLDKLSGERKLYAWDYYLHARPLGAYAGIPVYFPRLIAEDLRSLKGVGAGDFIEVYTESGARPDPTFAVNQLNCYVTARLWWDADQDVDALLDEYYAKYFGPAATPMKAFIEFSEANWPRMLKEAEPIDKALELMAAAREATGDGTIYARRVAWVDEFLKPLKQLREKLALGRKDAPLARVYQRGANITMDGKLDEAFWQDMATYRLREIETGRDPVFGTWFRAGWNGDNLYFGIHCDERNTGELNIATQQNEDPAIWSGDCIEILLETQSHAYYQIVVNPAGALMDADWGARGVNSLWSSEAEVAAHVGEGFWSIEIRIPAAGDGQADVLPDRGVSGRRPSTTHPWYFNVGRQRARSTGTELSMFSPTGRRKFHDPMKFGKLYVK